MAKRTLTVPELNAYIRGVFEDELILHDIAVEGEVYAYKRTSSASFVTLKEGDSLLQCVGFGTLENLETGQRVVLHGGVRYYEKSGKVTFVYRAATYVGAGNLLAELAALREKLRSEGLFAPKAPPVAPVRRIAVVTGESGIVIHDFLQTLERVRKFSDVDVYPCTVQGKAAFAHIAQTLRRIDEMHYDAVVIARGGGSNEDLSVFNDEATVRAVANCKTPTVSAIGHEADYTLCDFAAAVRAGTPSMAGEYICRRNEEFFARLSNAVSALDTNISRATSRTSGRLYRTAAALTYGSEGKFARVQAKCEATARRMETTVLRTYDRLQRKLTACAQRSAASAEENLQANAARWQNAVHRVDCRNPLRILEDGYAKLYGEDGQTLRYETAKIGEKARAVVYGGVLVATITEKVPTTEGEE